MHPRPGHPPDSWSFPGGGLSLDRPRIMGVLNLTPDSFSDGGRFDRLDRAWARAEKMVEEGADVLDVGGESTRPGAAPVGASEELDRVLPFLERAAGRLGVPLSVDTRKASVARAAVAAGAVIVNDVSGLGFDPELGEVVRGTGAGLVLMHMRGTPATMVQEARYGDVVAEVVGELGEALDRARRAGIPESHVVVDPGIGFAKTPLQSLELIRELGRFRELGRPILVGPSRKSFLSVAESLPPGERVEGTVAACVLAYASGARIFRVHDVRAVARGLRVARAVLEGLGPG